MYKLKSGTMDKSGKRDMFAENWGGWCLKTKDMLGELKIRDQINEFRNRDVMDWKIWGVIYGTEKLET